MKQIYELEYSDVQKINTAIMAKHTGKGIAVAVSDAHGELLSFFRTDDCPKSAIVIAQNKAFTAARDRQRSSELRNASDKMNFSISELGDGRFTGLEGGVPIIVEGQFVGAVGVSGLKPEEDAKLASHGIEALFR